VILDEKFREIFYRGDPLFRKMSTERKIEKCWMKNTYKESKKKHTGKSMEDTHRETGKSWMRDTERSWM
jgi:hypothetical protein